MMHTLVRLLAIALFATPFAFAQGITVVNLDGAGEGFNDPTPTISPITGLASTLGADRLACFDAAADVWEAVLDLDVEIFIGANFDPLGGTSMGSTPLGAAGPESVFRDFAGAPLAGTWFSVAQANQIFGGDLDPGVDDVGAAFNSDVDSAILVPGFSWYYGTDGAPPGGTIDFFSTVMHEIGHGVGFLSLVNLSTGALFSGLPDIYSLQLQHGGSGGDVAFTSLSNAGRVTAFTSVNELEWTGANVIADATFNPGGAEVLMYAPSTVNSGSTLSHWDTTNSPNLLMEPFATDPFTDLTLEVAAFQDMSWPLDLGPSVSSQTGGGVSFEDDNETLSATVINLVGGETFSWEHNSGPVSNGATGNGSTISGATTTSLTISTIKPADAGTYELFYNDGGGDMSLTTFSVSVIPAGVPVANWIGLGLVGMLLIAGGAVTLRRQRA